MENIKQIEDLLEKVNDIQKREKEFSKLRGEHFNVFRLLGLEGNEAGFHTKFLFELLNPQGSHDKGTIFFEEFIRLLNDQLPKQIEIPSYSKNRIEAKKEIYIGPVNRQDKEGGQMDLYFETDSFALAIENKIYSRLGNLQLERYQTFLKSKVNKNHYLILLSPFDFKYNGSLKEGNDFFHLKYSELIPWLEYCMEKSADSPILRETIKQYIISVKGILGILTNQEMKKELEDLILKNYDAARFISETFSQAKDLQIRKMYEILFNFLEDKYPSQFWDKSLDIDQIDRKDCDFQIRSKGWPNNVTLLFQGNRFLTKGIVVWILIRPIPDDKKIEILRTKFPRNFSVNEGNNSLYFSKKLGKYKEFNDSIMAGKSPEKLASEVLGYVEETVNKYQPEIDKISEILKD